VPPAANEFLSLRERNSRTCFRPKPQDDILHAARAWTRASRPDPLRRSRVERRHQHRPQAAGLMSKFSPPTRTNFTLGQPVYIRGWCCAARSNDSRLRVCGTSLAMGSTITKGGSLTWRTNPDPTRTRRAAARPDTVTANRAIRSATSPIAEARRAAPIRHATAEVVRHERTERFDAA